MTKLDDFNKIIVGGHEISKVLHQGKTIWQKEPELYLAQDSDFVKVEGRWVYRGAALEVEIPTHINGELVTSTSYMFSGEDSTWQATPVTKVVLNHSNVTNMVAMFWGSTATTLDLSSFDTSNVTDMMAMFAETSATTLDLSSFNTSSVTSMESIFVEASATIGYARTQADANKFNASEGKPAGLNFVVKP
jgi:surface protein